MYAKNAQNCFRDSIETTRQPRAHKELSSIFSAINSHLLAVIPTKVSKYLTYKLLIINTCFREINARIEEATWHFTKYKKSKRYR